MIYRFNIVPITLLVSYFVDIDKLTLRLMWKGNKPRIASTILQKKENQSADIPNFKTYSKPTVIVTVYGLVSWMNRHIRQWNRIKSSGTDSHQQSHLIFDKRAKATQWRKGGLFQHMVLDQLDFHMPTTTQKIHLDADLTPFRK